MPTPLQLALGEPSITSVLIRCIAASARWGRDLKFDVVLIAQYVIVVKEFFEGRMMRLIAFDVTKVRAV